LSVLRRISLLLPWFAVVLSLTSIGAALAVPSADARARELASHRPATVLAALRMAHHFPVSVKPATRQRTRLASISLVNQEWVCDEPVNLASVTVRMTSTYSGGRRGGDAVHLESGCAGRIGKPTVATSIADGVKVAEGAHDLSIGGSIRCLAKLPRVHQDGVQVMGGTPLTFHRLSIDCGRAGEKLINSDLFIKRSGRSLTPPTDVVCVGCSLGGQAAHTVDIQASVRSGVVSSTICQAKYRNLSLTIGSSAVDPVDVRNTLAAC
jgi:hypothetical protein